MMSGWTVWALIGALSSVTFATRIAFFLRPSASQGATSDPMDVPDQAAPPAEPRLLRFVSPAMLAALLVFALGLGGSGTPFPLSRWLAGLVGLAVALLSATHPTWRRYVVPLTLLGGLGTIWLLTLVGV